MHLASWAAPAMTSWGCAMQVQCSCVRPRRIRNPTSACSSPCRHLFLAGHSFIHTTIPFSCPLLLGWPGPTPCAQGPSSRPAPGPACSVPTQTNPNPAPRLSPAVHAAARLALCSEGRPILKKNKPCRRRRESRRQYRRPLWSP